jgi:hypothetical protein
MPGWGGVGSGRRGPRRVRGRSGGATRGRRRGADRWRAAYGGGARGLTLGFRRPPFVAAAPGWVRKGGDGGVWRQGGVEDCGGGVAVREGKEWEEV